MGNPEANSAASESTSQPESAGIQHRPWPQTLVIWATALLLLWACYDYGAFLHPSRLVVAIAFPSLGLVWLLACFLGRRHRRVDIDGGATAPVSVDHPRWGLVEWLLLALAALGALSAAWSLDWAASLQAAGILLGGLFLAYLGRDIGCASASERAIGLLLLVEMGVLVSLLAVAGYALRFWRFAVEQDGLLSATGTFGYANALAGMLLLTLAATAALYLELRAKAPDRLHCALLMIATLFQIAALVLTRSRAAAAVVVVLFLLFLIMRAFSAARGSRRHRSLGIALAVLLLCGLAAGGVLVWREVAPQLAVSGLPPAGSDPEDVVPMTSNSFRVKNWMAALEAFRERPFAGYGLGTFYEAYSPFKLGGRTAYAHNVIIQQLVEVGVIGGLALIAFLAAAVLRPLKTLLGPLRDPRIPLLLGALAFVLHNLVDLTWYFPALYYLFALVIGLMLSYSSSSHPPRSEQPTL